MDQKSNPEKENLRNHRIKLKPLNNSLKTDLYLASWVLTSLSCLSLVRELLHTVAHLAMTFIQVFSVIYVKPHYVADSQG